MICVAGGAARRADPSVSDGRSRVPGGGPWSFCRGGNQGFPRARTTGLPHALERREVLLLFPLGHLDAVLVPLAPLELHVAREDVVAERALHEVRVGELLDRLTERLRERDDAPLLPLVCREPVQV